MGRYLTLAITVLSLAATGKAQDSMRDDFDAFRTELLSGYQDYRQGVLADYSSFLKDTWERFTVFKGDVRDTTPKPPFQPEAPERPESPAPGPLPSQPVASTPPEPPVPSTPPTPSDLPASGNPAAIDFFGTTVKLAKLDVASLSGSDNRAVAEYWESLNRAQVDRRAIAPLKDAVALYRLNDWLTYKLVTAYVGDQLRGQSANTRMAVTHYLLCNLGYDARMALNDNDLILLMPFTATIYARSYMEIDGKRFSIYFDPESGKQTVSGTVYSYRLPKDRNKNRNFDPLFHQSPRLMAKAIPFKLAGAGIEMNGSLNGNLKYLLADYPQLPVIDYCRSVALQPEFRASLISGLKAKVSGLSEADAVNKLLHFVQSAFKYATDQRQFGFEKPLFPEESVIYGTNDCEDRAIFFSMLLRGVLGSDCVLTGYPGHIGVAVCLSDETAVNGTYYLVDGKRYYVADPTYVGANLGMCMPDYAHSSPEIFRVP